jgi:hypothetical protein
MPAELYAKFDFPHATHVFRAFQARAPSPKLPGTSTPPLEYTWIPAGILFLIPVPTLDAFCRAIRWLHAQARPYTILNSPNPRDPQEHETILHFLQAAIDADALAPDVLHTPPIERLWKELLAGMETELATLEGDSLRSLERSFLSSLIQTLKGKIERLPPLRL